MATTEPAATDTTTPLSSGEISVNRKLGVITKVYCFDGFQWEIKYDSAEDTVVASLLNPKMNSSWTTTVRITDVTRNYWRTAKNEDTVQIICESNKKIVFANKQKHSDLELKLEVLDYENVRFDCCYDFSAKNTQADRILFVGDRKFHVESAVLAFHSDYFAKLFKAGCSEADNSKEIELKNVRVENVDAFLKCVFPRCKSPINDDNLEGILRLARNYCCASVKSKCAQYLKNDSNYDAVAKYDYAHLYNLPLNCAEFYEDMLKDAKGILHNYDTMDNMTAETKDAILFAVAGCSPTWLKRRAAED